MSLILDLEQYIKCIDNVDCDTLLKILLSDQSCLSNEKVCQLLKKAVKVDGDGNIYLDLPINLIINGLYSEGITQIGNSPDYVEIAADGEITLHGTAGVWKSIWVPFNALKPPGTKPATFKEWGISGVWEFSDATDDTIVFNIAFPYDMDRTYVPVIRFGWSTNTAVITETAVWQIEYLYTAEGEDTTAGAQGTLTVNSNAIAQADGMIMPQFAGLDLPSATDICMHCRFKRLGADGNDDLTDTAELHGICFNYVSDKLGEPL